MGRMLLVVPAVLLLAGCTPEGPARTPASTTPAAPALQAEQLVGRWTGYWGGFSLTNTVLVVDTISPEGEVVGSYQFAREAPTPIRAPIDGNSFSFGTVARFTFTLQPDGRLLGERAASTGVARTVLTRQ